MIDSTTKAIINFLSDLKVRNNTVDVHDITADKFVSDDIVGDDATIENFMKPSIVVHSLHTTPDRRRMRSRNDRLILDSSAKIDIPYPIAIERVVNLELRTYRIQDEVELLFEFISLIRDGVDIPILFEFDGGYKWEPKCHMSPTQSIMNQSTTIGNYYYGLQLAQYSVKTWLPTGALVYEYPILNQRILRRTRLDDFDEIAYVDNLDETED